MNTKQMIRQSIEVLITGTREEQKRATQDLERVMREEQERRVTAKKSAFRQFVPALERFPEIGDTTRKAGFISALKYPMLRIGEEHAEAFASFLVAMVQHSDGHIRHSAAQVADWLVLSLTVPTYDRRAESAKRREESERRAKRNHDLRMRFAFQAEAVAQQYLPEWEQNYQYIDEMPPSIYKSAQYLMHAILRTPEDHERFEQWKDDFFTRLQKHEQEDKTEEEARPPKPGDEHERNQWMERADSFVAEFKPGRAVTVCKRYLETYPTDPDAHHALGLARAKAARFMLAAESFEKALMIGGELAEVRKQLGWAQVMAGELEKGRFNLREAINMDTANAHAYLDLAMSYIHTVDFETGEEFLKTARALAPEDEIINHAWREYEDTKKRFEKLTPEEQPEAKRQAQDPRYLRERTAHLMLETLRMQTQGEVTTDELVETQEELRRLGVEGMLGAVPAV